MSGDEKQNIRQWMYAGIAAVALLSLLLAYSPNRVLSAGVWLDEGPAPGTFGADGDSWDWQPSPVFSGATAHQSALLNGVTHQHYFYNAPGWSVVAGEWLYTYVYLDPTNPPSEVMLQWNNGTWEHRAIWGQDIIPWGTANTVSHYMAGSLPPTGQWVLLQVPASVVGIEGTSVNGLAFTLYGGKATWDKSGSAASQQSVSYISVPDGGFEDPVVGGGVFSYSPGGATWTFGGGSGVSGNASAFTGGNPNAPEGVQVGFLQNVTQISESIYIPAGTYKLNLKASQRSANSGSQVLQILLDGTQVGQYQPAGTTYASFSTPSFTVSSSGSHTLVIKGLGTGCADCTAFVDDVNITLAPDTTAPTVAITAPAGGASVANSVTLTANATDNVGVTGVQFQIDGANLGALVTTASNNNYSTTWDTTTATNAVHTIKAIAYDAAGNFTPVTISVTVSNAVPDTTQPSVSVTAPTNGATVSSTQTLTANATDNVAISSVQFQIDNVNYGAPVTTGSGSNYSLSWDTTTATNGTHYITAIAKDTSNNQKTSAQISVTVNNIVPDTTQPSVSVTVPTNGASVQGTQTLTANATDNVAISSVQFQIDNANYGAPVTVGSGSNYSLSWDTTTATNGTHTIQAIAKDTSNNQKTSIQVSVTVNNPWLDEPPVPGNAQFSGGDAWRWVNSPVFSLSSAHQSELVPNAIHQHYFDSVSPGWSVATGNWLYTYVYLDPTNPPSEVMLQWNVSGSWDHRAIWGQDLIPWGTANTVAHYIAGSLPATGQWVLLQVPASAVGLEGATVNGMAYTLYGGKATWDKSGITAAQQQVAQGTTGNSVTGWAWSDGIGWISLCGGTGSTAGSCDTSSSVTYGVTTDSNGYLSGYGWSDNIGWVKFGGLSSFPTGGGTTPDNAKLSNGQITGWARACAGTATGDCTTMTSRTDGWDGWIALSGTTYPFSVTTAANGNYLATSNVAWDTLMGWLAFNISACTVTSATCSAGVSTNNCGVQTSCQYGCDVSGVCAVGFGDGGFVSTNMNRYVPSLQVRKGGTATIYWQINNITSCTITGSNGQTIPITTPGNGSATSIPINTKTVYTMACTKTGGAAWTGTQNTITFTIPPEYKEN